MKNVEKKKIALLSDPNFAVTLIKEAKLIRDDLSITLFETQKQLIAEFELIQFNLLVSFGTGVIVPENILINKNNTRKNILKRESSKNT